jgi:hypothetical protein
MDSQLLFDDKFCRLMDRCVQAPGFLDHFNRLWSCTLTLEDLTTARMRAYADAADAAKRDDVYGTTPEAGLLVQKGREVCELIEMIHDTIWLRCREDAS